jgi:hypothetical protein
MNKLFKRQEELFTSERLIKNINSLIYGVKLMVEYAASKGKEIDANDVVEIENIFAKKISDDLNKVELAKYYSEIIGIHSRLSLLIKPATAKSLLATESRLGGLFYKNQAIKLITWITICSLVILILLNIFSFKSFVEGQIYLKILFASALGAGFSILTKIKKYIVNRTFEPRYNQGYLVTFIIGIIAGVILSIVFAEMVGKTEMGTFDSDAMPLKIGMTVIAIVGGYSARAVSRILERIAETLEAFVKGGIQDQVENEKEKTKAQEKQKTIALLQKIKEEGTKSGFDLQKSLDELLSQYLNED